MSKKFELLDHLILGQPESLELNVPEGITEAGTKSAESETKVEDKKELLQDDDGKLELNVEVETPKDKKEITDTSKKEEDKPSSEKEEEEEEEQQESTPEEALKHWSDFFKENSILNEEDLEGFNGSIESLSKAFEKREIRTGLEMVEDYKSQLPDTIKYLAENWEEGVPLTDILNIKSNQIKYAGISDEKIEENVDTQKMIYREFLKKTSKFSEAKIDKEVNRLLDTDELKDEAKEALSELKKLESDAEETLRKETKKEQERRRDENYKIIKSYEKASKELKEVIPGVKLTEKEQKDIFDKTINPIGIDGNGNAVSYLQSLRDQDPIGHDLKANYFALITKNYTDFSKITNSVTTKATKDLSKMLNSPPPKAGKDNINTSEKKGLVDYLSDPRNKELFKKQ